MEYIINVLWDADAEKWVASNDMLPISAESDSFSELKKIVADMANEMAELNDLPPVKVLCFLFSEVREVIGA